MHKACFFFLIFILISSGLVIYPAEKAEADIFDRFVNMQIEPINGTTAYLEPSNEHIFYFNYYNGGILDLYNFKTQFFVSVEGEGWTAYVWPISRWSKPNQTNPDQGWVYVSSSGRPSNSASKWKWILKVIV